MDRGSGSEVVMHLILQFQSKENPGGIYILSDVSEELHQYLISYTDVEYDFDWITPLESLLACGISMFDIVNLYSVAGRNPDFKLHLAMNWLLEHYEISLRYLR
jgi:hypothetical protein